MARLLVLWILSERASYGYEIKKALTDQGMAFWFGLEDASVYQVLRTLVDHYRVELVGLTRIEIAVLMGTTRDHVHPRIMELERGGWVERSEAPGRNGVVFVPTDKALTWQQWVDAGK